MRIIFICLFIINLSLNGADPVNRETAGLSRNSEFSNADSTKNLIAEIDIEILLKEKSDNVDPNKQPRINFRIAQKLGLIRHYQGAIKFYILAYDQNIDPEIHKLSKVVLQKLIKYIYNRAEKLYNEKSFFAARKFYKLLDSEFINTKLRETARQKVAILQKYRSPIGIKPTKSRTILNDDSDIDEELAELNLDSDTMFLDRLSTTPVNLQRASSTSLGRNDRTTPSTLRPASSLRNSPASAANNLKPFNIRTRPRSQSMGLENQPQQNHNPHTPVLDTVQDEIQHPFEVKSNKMKKSESEPNKINQLYLDRTNLDGALQSPQSPRLTPEPEHIEEVDNEDISLSENEVNLDTSVTDIMDKRQLTKTLEVEKAREEEEKRKQSSCVIL